MFRCYGGTASPPARPPNTRPISSLLFGVRASKLFKNVLDKDQMKGKRVAPTLE